MMRTEDAVALPCTAGAVLFALDVDVLTSFYVRALGFTPSARGDDHVVLQRAGFELTVHAVPRAFAAGIERATAANRRTDSAVKLVFAVADLSLTRTRVADCGGALDSPAREWLWQGVRVVDGSDPEGNVFQIRQDLAAKAR